MTRAATSHSEDLLDSPTPPGRPHGRRRGGVGLFWFVLALAALALQLWLLYTPKPPSTASFIGADKLVHLAMFGGVAWLFLMARADALLVVLASAAHAMVSELVQWRWVPGRSGSPVDALADGLGIALAWLAARWIRHWNSRPGLPRSSDPRMGRPGSALDPTRWS